LIALLLLVCLYPGHIPTIPLFPSSYPPRTNANLDLRLTTLASEVQALCPHAPEPVYSKPTLTVSQERRYSALRKGKGRYMIVTATKNIEAHISDLLNTILVLVAYLGADRLSFSILEGPSGDCTAAALDDILKPLLLSLGVPEEHIHIRTHSPKIDFNEVNRIEALAALRNQALEPLFTSKDIQAVVFFNDVFLHAEDILELLYQHMESGAGISTGWDWLQYDPQWYYDIWVGRTVSGLLTRLMAD
jgi:alpha-1,3-mannosyltransferase